MSSKAPSASNIRRDSYLRRVYGISLQEYNEILSRQGGGCAICGRKAEKSGKALAVEHDHKSGYIRGICCSYCNHRIIGRHRDPELLRRVADYVSRHTGFKVPDKKRKKRVRRNSDRKRS